MKNQDGSPTDEHPLVLFSSQDGAVTVPARLDRETVWLSQAQMAALFLYFLDKSRRLLTESGEKRLAGHTLVALTLMIAESKPAERELMVNLVMTFLLESDA